MNFVDGSATAQMASGSMAFTFELGCGNWLYNVCEDLSALRACITPG
jgi:hypothetical protein